MENFFEFLLFNAAVATILALVVSLLSRARFRPVFLHLLWALVLVRLVAPPILSWPVTVTKTPIPKEQEPKAPMALPPVAHEDPIAEPVPAEVEPPSVADTAFDSRKTTVAQSKTTDTPEVALGPPRVSPPVDEPAPKQTAPDFVEHASSAKATGFDPIDWLMGAWVFGTIAWVLLAIARVWRFRRALEMARPASDAILKLTASLAKELKLRRTPKVLIVSGTISPLVWPLGKASLILPDRLIDELSPDELSMVIGHELVHLVRRDHWMRYLEMLATGLFWWLPTVWLVRARLHHVEEQCCDAWIAHTWPERIADYSRALLKTAALLTFAKMVLPASGLGAFRSLEVRLTALAGNLPPHRLSRGWLVAGVLMACAITANSFYVEFAEAFAPETAQAQPEVIDQLEAPVSADNLPVRFDPIYKQLSPDGMKLAIVGSWHSEEDRYGLFLIDLKTGMAHHLVKKALKTNIAWSPDSKRIAFANAAGYVVEYPLAIVDVSTGQIEETGILGHMPDWSPDGSEIACLVDRTRADGVPDGRVGVWDLETRSLRKISPSGFNVTLQNGNRYVSGAYSPKWSPDGKQVAFLQHHREDSTKQLATWRDLWVVGADGDNLRLVKKDIPKDIHSSELQWSPDGESLVVKSTSETLDVTRLTPAAKSEWPSLPEEALREQEEIQAGLERAAKFDVEKVLSANRAWQKPDYRQVKSIEFTHKMSPIRLDERFSWIRDGAWSVRVLYREDDKAKTDLGKLWLTTDKNERFTMLAEDHYPRQLELTSWEATQSRFGHLMGTRANCVALDWGRRPELFQVVDAHPAKEPGQTVLELALDPKISRDYRINFGAMFHSTSWAYLHDLSVRRAELTIDDNTGRILAETSHTSPSPTQITFADWIERNGKSFPGSIRIANEHHQFAVEYQFQLLPQGVWLLKSGKSQFQGKEAQKEELVDLKINAEDPEVQKHLNRVREGLEELNEAGETAELKFESNRFHLGRREDLTWSNAGPAGSLTSVEFLPRSKGQRFREISASPRLHALFQFKRPFPNVKSVDPLLFVLYDEAGQPVHAHAIPLAAVDALQRPAATFLHRIREHSRLWLDPDLDQLKNVSYTFHANQSRQTDYAVGKSENVHVPRGVTMTTALDSFVKSPEKYFMPIHFTAKWNGRPVEVAVITGPEFGWVFGNGIENSWTGGYTVGKAAMATVIIDQATGQPLFERFGTNEVHFRDYVEAQNGQFVPRRIVYRHKSSDLDFRFQVADGNVWLLDRTVTKNREVAVWADNIKLDGEPAKALTRTTEPADTASEAFDWAMVTDRQVPETAPVFDRTMAEFVNFEAHPQFQFLGRLKHTGPGQLEFDLGHSPFMKQVHSWTLSRFVNGRVAFCKTASRISQTTKAVPFKIGERRVISAQAPGSKTKLRSVVPRFEEGMATASLELVSQDHYSEQFTMVSGVLLNSEGIPIAAGELNTTYRVTDPIYQTNQLQLEFGEVSNEASQKLQAIFGIQTQTIGGPLGSTWGRFYSREPVLPIPVLLSNPNPDVWTVGLTEIVSHHDFRLTRDGRDDDDRRRTAQQLAPYRNAFHGIFETAQDPSGLALLCRLAGNSEDRSFIARLVPLLEHKEDIVKDSAAVGLGLLGDGRASERIKRIIANTPKGPPKSIGQLNLVLDAKNALDVLGIDDKRE